MAVSNCKIRPSINNQAGPCSAAFKAPARADDSALTFHFGLGELGADSIAMLGPLLVNTRKRLSDGHPLELCASDWAERLAAKRLEEAAQAAALEGFVAAPRQKMKPATKGNCGVLPVAASATVRARKAPALAHGIYSFVGRGHRTAVNPRQPVTPILVASNILLEFSDITYVTVGMVPTFLTSQSARYLALLMVNENDTVLNSDAGGDTHVIAQAVTELLNARVPVQSAKNGYRLATQDGVPHGDFELRWNDDPTMVRGDGVVANQSFGLEWAALQILGDLIDVGAAGATIEQLAGMLDWADLPAVYQAIQTLGALIGDASVENVADRFVLAVEVKKIA